MSRPALSKEQEEEIQRLNQMSQQLRGLQQQNAQLEGQKNEISRTLDSLKSLSDDTEIFRQAGQILFKTDVTSTVKDLSDKLELLEIRTKQSTKQVVDYTKAVQDLDTKIRGYINI